MVSGRPVRSCTPSVSSFSVPTATSDAAGPGTMTSYSPNSSASTFWLSSVLLVAAGIGGSYRISKILNGGEILGSGVYPMKRGCFPLVSCL